jgi:hypothetical protein
MSIVSRLVPIFALSLGLFLAVPAGGHAQGRIVIRSKSDLEPKKISVDPIFEPGKLWTYTPANIETIFKDTGFKWLSDKKDRGELRRERDFVTRTLWAFAEAEEVEEVLFTFKDAKLSEVAVNVWNKGDAEKPDLAEADFNKKVAAWTQQTTAKLGVRPENRGRDNASAARAERLLWVGKETLAQLEYSGGKERIMDPFTGKEKIGPNFQGEFIRLRFVPKPATMVGVNTSTGGTAQVARGDLAKKLTKEANGDTYIPGIPMVDQGDKGYCAVATAARVLNYYGIPADQHEMAQVANTEAGGGTNPDEMETALKKLQGKYHVRLLQQIDTDYSSKSYQRFLTTYNRAAKKLNKRVLDTNNYIYFMGGLDAEVLREVRGKGPIFDKFMKVVHENIDQGVPLLWGLTLGKYPENGEKAKQFGGGHMRLIIGYNNTTNEVIFSDSWGAGHEKKRMAAPDASSATMALYTITPSQ